MTTLEKRTVERSNNFLMVNFRQANKSREFLLGIANNFSHTGISFEAARIESIEGEVLELILKNPYSELSVSAIGEIVWKSDGWYKCITGIKLKDVDQDAIVKFKDLTTNAVNVHNGPPSLHKDLEPAKEMEKEKIVVEETDMKSENMISRDHASSISKEETEMPAEKFERNIHQSLWEEKRPVSIINYMGLLFIVCYVLFIIFMVTTRGIRSENYENIKPSRTSHRTAHIKGRPLGKETTGSESDQSVIRPMPDSGITSELIEKEEKPDLSQNTSSHRGRIIRDEILFDLASDDISPIYLPEIDTFVKSLLSDPDAVLKIEGHADSMGQELYNLDLAMRRAWKVKKIFVNK